MTKRTINAALRREGIPLEIQHERGAGYCYFTREGITVGEPVMVSQLNHLTLDEWIEQAEAVEGAE